MHPVCVCGRGGGKSLSQAAYIEVRARSWPGGMPLCLAHEEAVAVTAAWPGPNTTTPEVGPALTSGLPAKPGAIPLNQAEL